MFSDRLRMVFIKLPLLTKNSDECIDILDRWLYILKNMEHMERIPSSFKNHKVFTRLDHVARVAGLSAKDRAAYDHSLKVYRDNYAIAETERAEGRVEGIAIGIENVARNMKNSGFDVATISKVTGLDRDKITAL